MMKFNKAGAQLSERGYVLCQLCGKELTMLSKDTAPHWAYCYKDCGIYLCQSEQQRVKHTS